MRIGKVVPLALVIAVIVVVLVLFFTSTFPFSKSSASPSSTAPNFTVPDIYGQNFTLSQDPEQLGCGDRVHLPFLQ